jgi:ubiquinone/menaquinone biosynthesis C-methylase UbiE/acyl carrier protein
MVWDETYTRGASGADPLFNTAGWNSSYSNLPIPAEEMQEWLDRTIDRIVSLKPRRVLEIGCGSGMVLFRIAPTCAEYWATDFSPSMLSELRKTIMASGMRLPQVTLLERPADDFSGIEADSFDLVILNSVVQYFPSVEYLERVLTSAVGAVAPGGAVFIGDVRNFDLLEALHASVQLSKAPSSHPTTRLKQWIDKQVMTEKELLVAPQFFIALKETLPKVGRAQVELKRGRHQNELNRFRYDVTLHVGPAVKSRARTPIWDWQRRSLALADLRRALLEERPPALGVTGVPNARLCAEMRLLELLSSAERPGTAAELRRRLDESAADYWVDPEEVWSLADEAGYSAEVCWSGEAGEGRFDVLFKRCGNGLRELSMAEISLSPPTTSPGHYRERANDPMLAGLVSTLGLELRSYLKDRLPDYMTPGAFVALRKLPLTPNGKLDRKALPEPETVLSASRREGPRTPTEEVVAGVWEQVLRLEGVGVNEDFFALGGHSLLATQVVSRLRDLLQVEIPLRALFEQPTVRGLAEVAQRERPQALAPPIMAVSREQELPLSFAQQRLWFIHQLEPESAAYNIALAVRLEGALELAALSQSLGEIARRHEALRTRFEARDGRPAQIIREPGALEASLWDLSGMSGEEREARAREVIAREAGRPFDLERGPVWRAALLRLSPQQHALAVTLHHVASDEWSTGLMIKEFAALYNCYRAGRRSALPELRAQYVDFALWQRAWLRGEVLQEQMDYWRRQLAGAPVLELLIDRSRPVATSRRSAKAPLMLPAELSQDLKVFCQREGVTLFMTLLAAFQTLLHRYTGMTDLVVGAPIANRNRVETEGLIGFFVNMLALRTDLSGRPTFAEALKRVRETTLGAFAHQDLPFEKLVEELHPERRLEQNPMFSIAFILQNAPHDTLELPGLTLLPFGDSPGSSIFDLALYAWEAKDGLSGYFEYDSELYGTEAIQRLTAQFQMLLNGVVAQPGARICDLPLLTDMEKQALLNPPQERSQVRRRKR